MTVATGESDAIGTSAAARIAGVSHDTMMRWVEEGRVESWRVLPRGWWRIDRNSLVAYLTRTAKGVDLSSSENAGAIS